MPDPHLKPTSPLTLYRSPADQYLHVSWHAIFLGDFHNGTADALLDGTESLCIFDGSGNLTTAVLALPFLLLGPSSLNRYLIQKRRGSFDILRQRTLCSPFLELWIQYKPEKQDEPKPADG